MPSVQNQRQKEIFEKRKRKLERRRKMMESFYSKPQQHAQSRLEKAEHLAGLSPEGLAGEMIMDLFILFFQMAFNTGYLQQVGRYDLALKQKVDKLIAMDLCYVERTPQNPQEWNDVLQRLESKAGKAYIFTGDTANNTQRLFFVDFDKGTQPESVNIDQAQTQQLLAELGVSYDMMRASAEERYQDTIPKIAQLQRDLANLPNNADNLANRARLQAQIHRLTTQSKVAIVESLDMDALQAFQTVDPGRTLHRQHSLAYCKQDVNGQPDPNGNFPRLYPIGGDGEPDYYQSPVTDPSKITRELIRANGYVPVPDYSEGLRMAFDTYLERTAGISGLDTAQLLRNYGVTSVQNQGNANDDMASDRAAQQMMMRQQQQALRAR